MAIRIGNGVGIGVQATAVGPGGGDTQVQYNNAGAFGGAANFTFNSGTGVVSATGFSGSGSSLTGIAVLNVANTFTKGQSVLTAALATSGTIAVDASLSNTFKTTLTGTATLANPTNLVNGQVLNFIIIQDGVGNRTLAYGSMYKFPGGAVPVLSTNAGAVDVLSGVYDSGFIFCNMNKSFA